jgi:F0F1-type ATP synthase assembly protein I
MNTWLHKLVVVAIGVAVAWTCFDPAPLTLPDNATYYQKRHFVSGIDLTATLFQIAGILILGAVLLYVLPQQLPSLRKRENGGQEKPHSQPTQHQEESQHSTPLEDQGLTHQAYLNEEKANLKTLMELVGLVVLILVFGVIIGSFFDSERWHKVVATAIMFGIGALIYPFLQKKITLPWPLKRPNKASEPKR